MDKKVNRPSKLDNPVLHFSSAVYKCKAQVCRLFVNGSGAIKNGERKITEGLALCLKEKVPTEVVLAWLNSKNVPNAHIWAIQYDKIQAKPELSSGIVKQEISWNKANDHASRPRMARAASTVERNLIHRLAVYTVKKEKDEEDIIRKYREEVEIVRGRNYRVDGRVD